METEGVGDRPCGGDVDVIHAPGVGLECRQRTPDLPAIERLLAIRYGYLARGPPPRLLVGSTHFTSGWPQAPVVPAQTSRERTRRTRKAGKTDENLDPQAVHDALLDVAGTAPEHFGGP